MARWFDAHLRGVDTGVTSEAPVQLFARHATRPEPDLAVHDGEWRAEPVWPPARLVERVLRPPDGRRSFVTEGDVGTTAWISCAGHLPWGQPSDQRTDDERSLTFDWPVDVPLDVLGYPRLRVRVCSDKPVASLSAKVCDVFPDGTSALVGRGYLNLAHRASSTDPQPLVPGEWYDVELAIDAVSWVFPPGHRVRLALAGADWPNIWPPPFAATLDFDRVELVLPALDGPPVAPAPLLAPPRERDRDPNDRTTDHEPVVWRIEHDVLDGVSRCVVSHGTSYDAPYDARVTESYAGDIDVSRNDPAVAHANANARFEVAWPDVTVSAEATLRLRSDDASYHVDVALDVDEGDERVARLRWAETIPRRLQ
jgi:hypothetical protein